MKPILFNAEMVRAVLDGRKTQTRRIVKFKDKINPGMLSDDGWPIYHDDFGDEVKQPCPYGAVGDELWVKERHYLNGHWTADGKTKTGRNKQKFIADRNYAAMFPDNSPAQLCSNRSTQFGWWKRSSLFMPRWASRIQLRITSVRVGRVQEITEDDCKREGVDSSDSDYGNLCQNILDNCGPHSHDVERNSADIACFKELWDSINSKRGYGWEKNPHVWVVEFEVVR